MRRAVARHGATLGLDEAKIVRLFSQGLTQTIIAERMSCSANAIRSVLNRHREQQAAEASGKQPLRS